MNTLHQKAEIIINQVEDKMSAKIPKETKCEILGSYLKHYEKLTEIIKRREKKKWLKKTIFKLVH